MEEIPGLTVGGHLHPGILHELPEAFRRAVRAGANPPLDYVGAGQYGIVFCDESGAAWKVARLGHGEDPRFMTEQFGNEYEWMLDAAGTPIAGNVARVYAFHPEEIVVERECVDGRPGTWADGTRLSRIHNRIHKVMGRERNWSSPEFKEDSYVVKDNGTPILVDISMVQRYGMNLAGWIEDVLSGRRKTRAPWHDLAFYLLQEKPYRTIPAPYFRQLMARLVEKDPEIARSFSL